MNRTREQVLRDDIIDLADDLDNKDELWEAWKKLNKAMNYLSARHTMAQVKEER